MGIGMVMHIIAKIVFVAVGYGIHMYLGKNLSPAEYGIIGVIMSIININYNFLSNGARQAASHLISSGQYNDKYLIKKSYEYQMIIAGVLSLINFLGADIFANILNTPEISSYIRITAFMIPFTAGYFISVGICNGLKLFICEAITVTIYPLTRLSIIPFVEFVFSDSALGTIAGFLIAAIIGCSIGILFVKRNFSHLKEDKKKITSKIFMKQILDFLSYFLSVTIILNMDMLFVNSLVLDKNAVGYYTGATNFAKVSYYLLSAIYLVALPVVTSKYSKKKYTECNKIITDFFCIILIFILPVAAIAAPSAGNLMVALYTESYRIAEIPTMILIVSQFFLGIFVILNVFICATSHKRFSTIIGGATVLADATFCMILIPKYSILGAALSTLLACLIGCIISVIKMRTYFKNIWNTLLSKVLLANFVLYIIMTGFNKIWITNNFFIAVIVCGCSYIIFIISLNVFKIIPVKTIIHNFMKIRK